jgi:hypothetical protein
LDSSAHSSDEDFDMANLAQPEKFQTWKRIKDEEKTRQALALYPEWPCCKFDGSRRQWLDGNKEAGKVMEYQEEPWKREDRCQVLTLPNELRCNADDEEK